MMTPRAFFDLLGSLSAQRLPGNRAHLAAYATPVAKVVPGKFFTTEVAEAVEPRLVDRMKLGELTAIIRQEGERLAPRDRSEPSEAPRAHQTEEEQWADRWFNFAQRRLNDTVNPATLVHLLSLLRAQSRPAWLRFADIHAPDVANAHREIEREIADRRAGLLPPLPTVHVQPKHPPAAFKRSFADPADLPQPAPSPRKHAVPRRDQDAAFNDLLSQRAMLGDTQAAERFRARTGRDYDAPVGMDERPFAEAAE